MVTSFWRVTKDEAVADQGMVAAKHPLAAEVGLEVLRRGGNAVDAAVTMAFALGVVEPVSSGLGGGGMMVIHRADTGQQVIVDYAMDAPLSATPDAYELDDGIGPSSYGWRKVKDDANVAGYRAAAVPGAVRGLALALERFGTISLGDALAPAIRFAEDGVDVNWLTSLRIGTQMAVLSRFPATAAIFLPGGFPLRPWEGVRPADQLVQADLARTLRLIAAEGPDAFYQGEIADAIAAAMNRSGGLIAKGDLARYQATVTTDGLAIDYRGYRIVGVPGACGTVTALEGLKILEGYDLSTLGAGSAAALHLQAEAFRQAFADRYSYVADPKQVAVPWRGLLSQDYAAALRQRIDPLRAAERVEPGAPWIFDEQMATTGLAAGRDAPAADSSTTTLCVVDRERNIVSLTQTLVSHFGCGVVVPGTGILLNNAMSWFDPNPGRPNSLAPGKRGLNNMTPLLVLADDRPLLAVGSVGGRKIVQAVAHVIMNVVDHGFGMQDAITTPRIDCSGPAVLVDARFPETVPAALEAMGHQLRLVEESFHAYNFSTPVGILIHPATGQLHGGVDPFRIAVAAGY